jgi:hypothetical protein
MESAERKNLRIYPIQRVYLKTLATSPERDRLSKLTNYA